MRLTCDHFNTRLLIRFILAFVVLGCAKLSHGLDPSRHIFRNAHTAWRIKDGTCPHCQQQVTVFLLYESPDLLRPVLQPLSHGPHRTPVVSSDRSESAAR